MQKFWQFMFVHSLRKICERKGGGLCSNRSWFTLPTHRRNVEITVIFRDTSKEDTYSREEVYRMLKAVREEEIRTGWICPDPVLDGKAGSPLF